jgi:hypothetical protein
MHGWFCASKTGNALQGLPHCIRVSIIRGNDIDAQIISHGFFVACVFSLPSIVALPSLYQLLG